jgi:hypothetical protein
MEDADFVLVCIVILVTNAGTANVLTTKEEERKHLISRSLSLTFSNMSQMPCSF